MTLAFLGEKPASILPELSRILDALPFDAIRLQLDKTGYFPHSRICWAGMEKTPPELIGLHQKLVMALSEKSVSFDKRNRFKPHITLARHADRTHFADVKPIIWQANRLVLVESRPRQDRKGTQPQYIPIAERKLGK